MNALAIKILKKHEGLLSQNHSLILYNKIIQNLKKKVSWAHNLLFLGHANYLGKHQLNIRYI